MEQNTTVVETITHHHIIRIFFGHKAQLTNIEMAKAVVALNPQLFQHMIFRKEKDYYEIYMHIHGNVLAEHEKIKKLNKSEEIDQLSELIRCGKVYKPPSTNAERSQYLSLTPRKRKFKSDLEEKKQYLSKSKKLLLEKSKDLENMKKQLEIRQTSVELQEKEKEKEHLQNQNLSVEIAKIDI